MDNKKCNTQLLSMFLVLVYIYTLKGGNGEVIRCIEKERQALLKFKQEIVDDDNALSSWGSEENKRECCKWRGIGCSNRTGHVIDLHLNNGETLGRWNALRGNISNALVDLHHLINLDLGFNNFSNNEIPEFIGSLNKLRYLNLVDCSLTGKVPSQLGNLTNLRALDLGDNRGLVIQNLDWLSNLSSLSLLDFSGLSFNESFETTMFQKIMIISSLKKLYLGGCNFPEDTSSVDVYVKSTFPSLSVLDLSGTGLTSSAFHWLFNISTSLVSIYLYYNQLDGPIPDAFGQKFVFLENLGLSFNRFEGEIPKSLWNLTSLKKLYISHNNLLGPLPEFLASGELSKLEVLDVSFNSLPGKISESHLSKLHNLKRLDLSHNSLVLNLTPDWTPPFNLDSLELACCDLGSRFPTWVLTQSNVTILDLSCTNISDELPKLFWDSFPRLEYLNLSHNQISGKLPDLSSKLFGQLDLSFNEFSGRIPSFHPNARNLYLSNNKFFGTISFVCKFSFEAPGLLDLSNNQLSGQLPNCWENISLIILDLSNNSFSGKIPNSLGHDLWTLHLRNNNLSGELPSGLNNSRSLFILDVGGNELTGNIPTWIGMIANLVALSIRGNNFFGSIPPEICHLTQIQILDLSRNNLSGKIPIRCFENFTDLIQKNRTMIGWMSKIVVQLKGQEYEYSNTIELLKLIDLSSNRIEGNIPIEIFQMEGLISLNLSRNHLRGNIDPAIHRMESLESLDLSRNQLSGEIPMGLGMLASLDFLDLSNNNFSGKIPSGTQLQGFSASAYAGNIGLCGPPLPKCPEDGPGPLFGDHGKLDDGDENDDVLTIQSFLKEFYVAIVWGFTVGFWGIIGTLILKKSWRYAYFQFLDRIKDCPCLKAALCIRRLRLERPHIQA